MKYVILIAIPLILGTVGGFAGGLVVTHNAELISAKEFIVLDQAGRPRAVLAVLPQHNTVPRCNVCDGQPHLIVVDQQMIWPPSEGQLSAADLAKILRSLLR